MEEARVVQVNIWKELQKEITKTIGVLRGLVVLTHNSVKFIDIVDFLNKILRRRKTKTIQNGNRRLCHQTICPK